MRARLSLESLETRETPAGVVNVTLSGGTITLRGDGNAFGNQVELVETAQNTYDIVGEDGTLLRLNNGPLVAVIPNVIITRNINATFGAGPDRFEYTGNFLATLDDFNLNMGGGDDTVTIDPVFGRSLNINQGIAFYGTTDNDTITVRSGGAAHPGGFRGGVTLNNYAGQDVVDLQIGVMLGLKVNNQGGGDTVSLTQSTIGQSIHLGNTNAQVAGNTIEVQSVSAGGGLVIQNPGNFPMTTTVNDVALGGNLSITNGSINPAASVTSIIGVATAGGIVVNGGNGWDDVDILAVVVGGGITVNSGNGLNTYDLIMANAGGPLNYLGTNGNDIVNVTATRAGAGKFTLGFGDNGLYFNGDIANPIQLAGPLTISFGGGFDQLLMSWMFVHGATQIGMGQGTNFVSVAGGGFYGGNFVLQGGPQSDTVDINAEPAANILFQRNLQMRFGLGLDTLNMGTAGGQVVLHGLLSLDDPHIENRNIGPFFRRPGLP